NLLFPWPIASINVEVLYEGIDNYCPRNGTTSSVGVSGNIQLSGWPDQCFRAGANNPNIGSAQVRQSHWVRRVCVLRDRSLEPLFIFHQKQTPRLVRVQNVLQLCG